MSVLRQLSSGLGHSVFDLMVALRKKRASFIVEHPLRATFG
jgi:hypothetical protein